MRYVSEGFYYREPPTNAEVIHTELAAVVSSCDDYIKWGRIEVSWWG